MTTPLPVTSSHRLGRTTQTCLTLRTWGGRRRNAGRKPTGRRAGVAHRPRPSFASPQPLHVTFRMAPGVFNLRSRRAAAALRAAFAGGQQRFGARVIQFSIQGNHIHLLVEAPDDRALSRAMKGLAVRCARRLNRMMGRKGRVLGDRFHARLLRSPREARHAVRYLRDNHHRAQAGDRLPPGWLDPYWSGHPDWASLLPQPTLWLFRGSGP
jgi:REP element-mobilizing transposase RayT